MFVRQMNVTSICTVIAEDTPPSVFLSPCPPPLLAQISESPGCWGAVLCQAWRAERCEPGVRKGLPPSAQKLGSRSQMSRFGRRHPGSLALLSSLCHSPEGQVFSDWLPQDASQASGVSGSAVPCLFLHET